MQPFLASPPDDLTGPPAPSKLRTISLAELEHRCQKPDHRRIGNWMARRISRPAALRITWIVAPWGISANKMTLVAWSAGIAAALAFGWGTPAGWLMGAALMQLWYLLDHVDGQLARLHGTASLDGVQLDYLMHHILNLLIPVGVGWGLFARTAEPAWCGAGLVWGLSLLIRGLHHDARYKAFIQRLKALEGTLEVSGGAGSRRAAQPPIPREPMRLAAWTVQKACEPHVVMNLLTLTAAVVWFAGDADLFTARWVVLPATAVSVVAAVATVVRSQQRADCEREFSAWFRVPAGHEIVAAGGYWTVKPPQHGEDGKD